MTNYKGLLTKELQALYPDFTDIELNEMELYKKNLVEFSQILASIKHD